MTLRDKVNLLISNMQRAISDFNSIKTALIEKGADMPEGTSTSDYPEKINEVYEAGKSQGGISEEMIDTFWNAICGDGKIRQYNEAFKNLNFDSTTYKPTKNVTAAECASMFENCSVGLAEEKQVCVTEEMYTFDFSSCPKVTKLFYNCGLFKSFFSLSFTGVDGVSAINANNVFYGSSIQRIEYLYPSYVSHADRMFTGATKLSYIGFGFENEVDTVRKSIKLQDCPLVVESAISLFTHIKNFAGTDEAFKYTITLSEDLWAELDALGNVSPNGNKWREYCNDLGWNT